MLWGARCVCLARGERLPPLISRCAIGFGNSIGPRPGPACSMNVHYRQAGPDHSREMDLCIELCVCLALSWFGCCSGRGGGVSFWRERKRGPASERECVCLSVCVSVCLLGPAGNYKLIILNQQQQPPLFVLQPSGQVHNTYPPRRINRFCYCC